MCGIHGCAVRPPLAVLIGNAPAGDRQQPGFEGSNRPAISEVRHFLGHGDDRFLHDFLRLRVRQPGLDGDAVDQFSVGVEKLAPALLVLPIFQTAEQGLPGRNELIRASGHRDQHSRKDAERNHEWTQCGGAANHRVATKEHKRKTNESMRSLRSFAAKNSRGLRTLLLTVVTNAHESVGSPVLAGRVGDRHHPVTLQDRGQSKPCFGFHWYLFVFIRGSCESLRIKFYPWIRSRGAFFAKLFLKKEFSQRTS